MAAVLLHGRGRTPEEMIGLADRLSLDSCRWVVPAAATGSWYPHRFMEPLDLNEPSLSRAIDDCDRAVDDASEQGRIPSARIVVIGFSQGACLAAEYALRHPGRCGALVMFTGGLIGPQGVAACPAGDNAWRTAGIVDGKRRRRVGAGSAGARNRQRPDGARRRRAVSHLYGPRSHRQRRGDRGCA